MTGSQSTSCRRDERRREAAIGRCSARITITRRRRPFQGVRRIIDYGGERETGGRGIRNCLVALSRDVLTHGNSFDRQVEQTRARRFGKHLMKCGPQNRANNWASRRISAAPGPSIPANVMRAGSIGGIQRLKYVCPRRPPSRSTDEELAFVVESARHCGAEIRTAAVCVSSSGPP